MTIDNLVSWLVQHSERVDETETETVYTHFTGETSVLVRASAISRNLIPVQNAFLSSFYNRFHAASIGDGHVVIAANIIGGVSVSHGYTIMDLNETRETAENYGMQCGKNEEVFMQSAGWMFLYSIDQSSFPNGALRIYDRDFQKSRELSGGIADVLDEWWSIVLEDQ
jgi:hypothetical protein